MAFCEPEGLWSLKKPDWQRLCAAAANEEDPEKLMELIAEIDRDLQVKEERLRQQYQPMRQAANSSQANLPTT